MAKQLKETAMLDVTGVADKADVRFLYNGFAGQLSVGARYRKMLTQLLVREKINLTLYVPGNWARDEIAKVLERPLTCTVEIKTNTRHVPSMLLIREWGIFSGCAFDHRLVPIDLSQKKASELWDFIPTIL